MTGALEQEGVTPLNSSALLCYGFPPIQGEVKARRSHVLLLPPEQGGHSFKRSAKELGGSTFALERKLHPPSKPSSSASPITFTPSEIAFSSLLPASSPASR